MQDAQNNVAWDAVLFMNGSQLHANLVQHAVLMLSGNQTDDVDAATGRAATKLPTESEPYFINSVSAWVEQSSISNNLLLSSSPPKGIREALAPAEPSPLAPFGGAARDVQQFFIYKGTPSAWIINTDAIPIPINNISNPLVVALHQDEGTSPDKSKQLVPLQPKSDGTRTLTCEAFEPDTRVPSVYLGAKSSFVGKSVSFSGNQGFPYAFRHSGWLTHLQDIVLSNNTVSRSLVDVLYANTVIKGLVVEGNTAKSDLVLIKDAALALLQVSRLTCCVQLFWYICRAGSCGKDCMSSLLVFCCTARC